MPTFRARASLAILSRLREPQSRLAITTGIVVVALVMAEVASAIGGGRYEIVALGTALGLAPLACALYRSSRRASSHFDITPEVSPDGLRCADLFGDQILSGHELLGACVLGRPPEPTVVLTTRDAIRDAP